MGGEVVTQRGQILSAAPEVYVYEEKPMRRRQDKDTNRPWRMAKRNYRRNSNTNSSSGVVRAPGSC